MTWIHPRAANTIEVSSLLFWTHGFEVHLQEFVKRNTVVNLTAEGFGGFNGEG